MLRVVSRIDFAGDVLGPDPGEAAGKPLELGDEFLTECEYVHQRLPDSTAWARTAITGAPLHKDIERLGVVKQQFVGSGRGPALRRFDHCQAVPLRAVGCCEITALL